jgi:hypothetical protein
MYKKILKLMEKDKDKVSFYSRMEAFNSFLEENDLLDDLYEPHVYEPVSFVWAISSISEAIFAHQIGAISQFEGIFQDHDQLIFVVDAHKKELLDLVGGLEDYIDTKKIIINRGLLGDRPSLNWDIGIDYAKHERVCCIRDLVLFFQPWDFVRVARELDIKKTLTSFTTVLGAIWSRYADQWVYLVHPKFAPTSYLFSFVASKSNIQSMNGFDQTFARGFDHSGELDFLLRWAMKGYDFQITDKASVFHPGLPANQQDVEEMKFQSSVVRRYFMDRYGEDMIATLKPPFVVELPLIEVNSALTLSPLMEVKTEEQTFPEVKDAFTFSKRPNSAFIVEEL